MKGLVFTKLGQVELRDVEKPVIINGSDVIIRITLTAICGSDLHLIHGHIPSTPGYILGHEYVGVVETVGPDVKKFKRGDRVIGPGTPFCGKCVNCNRGHIYRCLNGGILGSGPEYGNLQGTHCEYTRIPFADENLIRVPDGLSDEQVLFVGDILGTGYFASKNGSIRPGSTVVVVGAGPVGLCTVSAARLFNPKQIILVDNSSEYRLQVGKKLGATHTIFSKEQEPLAVINDLTDGNGADVVIEAVGIEETLQQCAHYVSIGGTISIVGVPPQKESLPMFEMFMKNVNVKMGLVDLKYMQQIVDMIVAEQLDLLPLITHRMKLSEIEKAFELFDKRKDNVIKVVITP